MGGSVRGDWGVKRSPRTKEREDAGWIAMARALSLSLSLLAMKVAILVRTTSVPAQPLRSLSDVAAASLRRSRTTAKFPLHIEIHPNPLRRARSDADLTGSGRISTAAAADLWSPPEVDEDSTEEEGVYLGSLDLWREAAAVEVEDVGGGMGKGRTIGGGGGGGGGGDEERRLGDYYRDILRADPGNPLLLRNYGRFLHEEAGDVERAEECYGRAILASPGDGDVLALYGKLLWEAHGDGDRAAGYFERAVESSPDDCNVLGSYAKFLWDTEEEEEVGEESMAAGSSSVVKVF